VYSISLVRQDNSDLGYGDGGPLREPLQQGDVISWLAFSPDGEHLASCSSDSNVWIWDLRTEHPVGRPLNGHQGLIFLLHFRQMASASFRVRWIVLYESGMWKQGSNPESRSQMINPSILQNFRLIIGLSFPALGLRFGSGIWRRGSR
jgi:WD40 repeat protein